MRFHTNLPVRDLEATERFYRAVLGTPPVKRKTDYLKFLAPGLNISFHLAPDAAAPTWLHLGFEVSDQTQLDELYRRLQSARFVSQDRETSVCCYALQDKFWVTDPTGYRWELYLLVEDREQRIDPQSDCCSEARTQEAIPKAPAQPVG